MSFNEYFTTKNSIVRVINLKERKDRRKEVKKVLNRKKINFDFYITTKNINPKRGCLLSHLDIIKYGIKTGIKYLIIFEDDILFIKSPHIMKTLPPDWDMIYLGGTVHRIFDNKYPGYSRVSTWTTHAYILNLQNGALINKVLACESFDGEIDRYYLEEIHPYFNCYMTNPMICIQNENYSDIENRMVNYSFMEQTLNGLRTPEYKINELNEYILLLPNVVDIELPNISIITPTYKRRKMFYLALHNFERFIYPKSKIEWIIIDDTPNDNDTIGDIIAPIKGHYNIKYLRLSGYTEETKLTVAMKRNIGVQNATADFIIHMDDDDYYPPESLLSRVKLLIKYEVDNIKCVGSSTIGTYNLINNTSSMSSDGPISLSEASMAYKKEFWLMRQFDENVVRGEHKSFTEQRLHNIMDVPYCFIIIAFSHTNNITNELRSGSGLLCNKGDGNIANFYDSFDDDTKYLINALRKNIMLPMI